MKTRISLGLAVAAGLIALLTYRACAPGSRLNVDSHTAREIEKAKDR